MELFRDDDLAATLHSLRPTPRAAFAAELDERAAVGFPRRSARRPAALGRLRGKLRTLPPRRLLLTGAVTALAAIAAATVVVTVNRGSSGGSNLALNAEHRPSPPVRSTHRQVEFEASAPSHLSHLIPARPARASAEGAASGSETSPRSFDGAYTGGAQPAHRDIERSAAITLGADPSNVGKDAARVFEAVHANRGIVLSSSIRESEAAEIGARFNLLIPSAKLDDALAAISEIGEVRSRRQSTADITAPTVNVGERLRDSQARVEGLLHQLAAADTDAARQATEAELRGARRDVATLRSRFATLRQRANLSKILVLIETGEHSGSANGGSTWDAGDALGDAGHILSIAAGVAIVTLAVVAPLALIALLAWLAHRAWLRRRRERTLG